MPTLEHIDRSVHNLNFAIVSWKVNDAKNNLNIEEFLELCKLVISKENNIITKTAPYFHNGAIKEIKDASIKIAVDSVIKIISTSVDKSKLDAVFQKNLDETKEQLKKISS